MIRKHLTQISQDSSPVGWQPQFTKGVRALAPALLLCLAACGGGSGQHGTAGGQDVLFGKQPSPLGIAVDGDDLYWSNCGTACVSAPAGVGIWRAKHDGSGRTALSTGGGIRGIYPVGDSLYYVRDYALHEMPRDGGEATKVASPLIAIAGANDKVYALEGDQLGGCTTARVKVFDGHGKDEVVVENAPCAGALAVSVDAITIADETSPYPNAVTTFSRYSFDEKQWVELGEIESEVESLVAFNGAVYFRRVSGAEVLQGISADGDLIEIAGQDDENKAFTVHGDRLFALNGNGDLAAPMLHELSGDRLVALTTLPDNVRSIWAMAATDGAVFWTGADKMRDGVVGVTPIDSP